METGYSQLFTVRVWQEALDDGQTEWRGSIQRVLDGQVRYFRSWQMLADCLSEMLHSGNRPGGERADVNATTGGGERQHEL